MESTQDQKLKGKSIIVVENEPEIIVENQATTFSHDEEDMLLDLSSADEDTDSDYDSIYDGLSDMEELPVTKKASYKIVSQREVRQSQEEDIETVSNILSISRAKATVLLIHSDWRIENVTQKWFDNPEKFREEVGLSENFDAAESSDKKMICGKCNATVDEYLGVDGFCNHKFCNKCWKDIIGTSLKTHCLVLKCPDVSCNAPVNQDMMSMLASESDQGLYAFIFLRSYLNSFTKGKWCPSAGCNHAVLPESDSTIIQNFTCKCLFTFCYKCLKEAHQPVSCATVEDWRTEALKHSQIYSSWQGDKYADISPEDKVNQTAEMKNNLEKARNALARFHMYLSYCNGHDLDQQQAILKLRTMQNEELKVLAEKQGISLEDASFVTEAWLQAAECKRVFKWAAVFDYYFLEFEQDKRSFYNELIYRGGFVLVELCNSASKLRWFIGADPHTDQFADFRERLRFKTSVARNFFENMEIAIRTSCSNIQNLHFLLNPREATLWKPAIVLGTTDETSKAAACPHCGFPNENWTTKCIMCNH